MEDSDQTYTLVIAILGGFIINIIKRATLYWSHGQANGSDFWIIGFFGAELLALVTVLILVARKQKATESKRATRTEPEPVQSSNV